MYHVGCGKNLALPSLSPIHSNWVTSIWIRILEHNLEGFQLFIIIIINLLVLYIKYLIISIIKIKIFLKTKVMQCLLISTLPHDRCHETSPQVVDTFDKMFSSFHMSFLKRLLLVDTNKCWYIGECISTNNQHQ